MNQKLLLLTIVAVLVLTGCIEEEKKTTPIWGKGELPADFVSFFGTGNNARLNKAQNDEINRHRVVIHGMDQVKNGKKVHIPGIIDLIGQLDVRLQALEAVDPNEVAIESRVDVLEGKVRATMDAIERMTKHIRKQDEVAK